MSLILHLGVVDMPYSGKMAASVAEHFSALQRGKPLSRSAASASVTTGQVAEFLEAKYHVMETFYTAHSVEIGDAIADSLAGAFESAQMGAPRSLNIFGKAEGRTKRLFSKFLESKEMDHLGIPGVPTRASLEGVSHRFKGRRAKGPRPSFIDTGLYETSFAAWIDQG